MEALVDAVGSGGVGGEVMHERDTAAVGSVPVLMQPACT